MSDDWPEADRKEIPIREATPDDRLGVRRVLDAAMLSVRDDLPERIEDGDVLVATGESTDSILGALVLVPRDGEQESGCRIAHIDAVAVRRARRGRGVGTELVRAAWSRYPRLTAEFDPDVRPFYESLGFEISAVEDGRLRGRYGFESSEAENA